MSAVPPNPILGRLWIDYEESAQYCYKVEKERGSIKVEHELTKHNLVADAIEANEAFFFTTIVAKGTLYRESHPFEGDFSATDETKLIAKQEIKIPEFYGSPALYIHAGIANKEKLTVTWQPESKLDEFWKKRKELTFQQYSLLASGGWCLPPPMAELFNIIPTEDVNEGEIKTFLVYDSNYLSINIHIHPKFSEQVKKQGKTRSHVITVALAQALQQLKDEYEMKEDWSEEVSPLLSAATELGIWLKNEYKTSWEDDDFNPSYIATCFRNIISEND